MSDNVSVTPGSGITIAADEVSDGTLGSCKVQYVKIMDGTLDGTTKAAVSSLGLKVNLGADNAVTAVGTIADDATTPGNPVMIGGYAVETDGTDPTSVSAENDVTLVRTDRNRRMLVNIAHPNLWTALDNQSSAQTNTQLKAAPGASLSFYITDVIISNGATAGNVKIVEDQGGTPSTIMGPYYFAANGGAAIHLMTPKRMTANKSLGYTSATVTTHTVEVHGYVAP